MEMKKQHLACAGLIALACTLGTTSCSQGSPKDEAANSQATEIPAGGLKIAYVEIDTLMSQYEFCKDYTILMNRKGENIRATLAGKERALQAKAAELQKKYETNQFTTKEQVEQAVEIFKERYPNLIFAGYRNGYFTSENEMDEEAKHIVKLNPDFLIVGMGILMQEKFLLKVKDMRFQGVGFTCGGFIHQTAKNEIDYYPAWADRLNLRFIYRMYKEPHTRKRYLQAALLFPARFIFERIFG